MSPITNLSQPLIMLGAGGHGRVMHALALAAGFEIIAVCDPLMAASGETAWRGIPLWADDEMLARVDPDSVGLINGVGQLVRSKSRESIYQRMTGLGFRFPQLVHPQAWVERTVDLRDGVQVMAGAIIQPGCSVGENTIINTSASIDHDCVIGSHVHIAPGAVLCGGVSVGDRSFIGAGSTVIQQVAIGSDAIVGAGALLTRNLANGDAAYASRAISS
jgi:UDP-perosamine 4-acetyltransferase